MGKNVPYMGGGTSVTGVWNSVTAVESCSWTIIHRRGGEVRRGGVSRVKLEMLETVIFEWIRT